MVCDVSLLMPNSSAINLSVSHRSCASICHTFTIIPGVLLVDGRPERGSSLVVFFLRESVCTIRKPIFCSRLPSRTPAPTFNASPLKFPPPICSRTWCFHVSPLRCDTTSHTDYVQLAAVGLQCRSHAVHDVYRFSPFLWRNMRMRAHMRQVVVDMAPFTELFRHTLYIVLWILCEEKMAS